MTKAERMLLIELTKIALGDRPTAGSFGPGVYDFRHKLARLLSSVETEARVVETSRLQADPGAV